MPDALPPDVEPAPDLTGRTVGDYQVLRKLGEGGMGQVYLARQLSLKREVALKILRKDLADNPTALKRFQAEAEAVARVTHANIVQVYAVGEHDGLRFMALEYVEGRNLRDYLSRRGPPDLPVAVAILRQVAAALQRASEIGIVHRDIKPENILVTKKVEVKVADFGLSRYFATEGQPLNLTQSGMTLGTPLYMSPEQVQGHPVDHRSDIYSFGVTAYHLLAGHPPFQGASPFEVAVQHVQSEPPPLSGVRPDLPADLCAVVARMMAKRPADRYQTAKEITRDLGRVQKGLPVGGTASTTATSVVAPAAPSAPAATAMYVPVAVPEPPATRWALRAAAVASVVALGAGGWWAFGQLNPPPESRAAAAVVGLPDGRPAEPVVGARERELKAVLDSRAAKPDDLLEAAIGLGLLYVRERRLDEADDVFKRLETERVLPVGLTKEARRPFAVTAGMLGQAVVLAHRDNPKQSVAMFEASLTRFGGKVPSMGVQNLLLKHPELGEAVAAALNRNADGLAPPAKLPERLDWLRSPSGLARGPLR